MSATRLSRAVRLAVYNRDQHQCCNCARGDRLTIQHRKNKGMGGSKLLDGIENLMTLCDICNTALEQDADLAAEGRQKGHKLRPHEDPFLIAIWVEHAREWHLLDDHGSFIVAAGRDTEPNEGLFA